MFLSEAVTIDTQQDEEFNSDAMDGKLQRESKRVRLGYKGRPLTSHIKKGWIVHVDTLLDCICRFAELLVCKKIEFANPKSVNRNQYRARR
jgi:hypothetical protein